MASPLRRALSSGSSSAPARPSRLSHEVHFDPSSSSSDEEPDDTRASDADTSDNDEGDDDVCELPVVSSVPLGHGHSRGGGVSHHANGRGGGNSNSTAASRSLRVAHLSSGLSQHSSSADADADDDDGNSEYTDTDDDDYQAPQLPLTDSLQHHEQSPVVSSDPWAAYHQRQAASSHSSSSRDDAMSESPIAHFNLHIQSYEPAPWEQFFAGGSLDVPAAPPERNPSSNGAVSTSHSEMDAGTFRVYWTASSDLLQATPKGTVPQSPETLFVLIHGAGQGALSYAVSASLLVDIMPNCVVVAADLRGHGHSTVANNVPLTRAQYASDLATVLHHVFPGLAPSGFAAGLPLPHDVVLVGHSLGGAIAAQLASSKPCPIPHLLGVAVLDVVEGTAMDALIGMRSLIAKWPSRFASVEAAVRWAVESGQVNNPSSACVSVPAQVMSIGDGPAVRWRTDLLSTEPFWEDWYKGLSSMFLSSPAAKLLVLAGTDRLDRELTIGQMQGKFQMEVMQNVGHNLHEDAPSAFAHVLAGFAKLPSIARVPTATSNTQPVAGMFAVAPAASKGKAAVSGQHSFGPPMALGSDVGTRNTSILPARLPPR
ncbi:Alpha/Beta hydrolase protein [Catenaria anguillulae PL171]|uniref:Protein phosphatase methylesterase 1 n=1 Tax=Catenaria anguillulae PL171 TaxID=765915 RepID=A0A1Y2I031_9FUNG|nr:Alpha/Beta hydrolase protein [Catenaria anguillulae PL171]